MAKKEEIYVCMRHYQTFKSKKIKLKCTRLPKRMPTGFNEKDYLPSLAVGKYVRVKAKNIKQAESKAKKRI